MGYVSFDLPANRIALAEQVSRLSCIMMVRIPRCTAFCGKFLLPFTCCHDIIVAPFSWNDLPFGFSSLCTFFFFFLLMVMVGFNLLYLIGKTKLNQ